MSGIDLTPGEIVVHQPQPPMIVQQTSILSDDEISRVWRIAKALAGSGMFKDVTQAEQAFGRILLGRDLGLTPTQALMTIDVVEGNPRFRSSLLAGWIRDSPKYDYEVREHDEQHCVIEFFRLVGGERKPFDPPAISAFSMEDAKKAHLVKDHPKAAWKAHPRNMLWARAMSNGFRWFCSDLAGGIPVYTEADSFVDSTAVEIGDGEGSGEAPPWDGVSDEHVARVEELMARAEAINFLGLPDMATVRMKLNGQKAAAVEEWVAAAEEQVAVAVVAVEAKAAEGGDDA